MLLCTRIRHTSFKNYSGVERALSNVPNTQKLATELIPYRAHAIMQLTMSKMQEKTCMHNLQVQTRQRRKKCFTELVPFKHMRPCFQECQSPRTIFECVYAVWKVQLSGITHQGQNPRVLAWERRTIWASKQTYKKGESRLKQAAAKVSNAQQKKIPCRYIVMVTVDHVWFAHVYI